MSEEEQQERKQRKGERMKDCNERTRTETEENESIKTKKIDKE